MVFQRTIPVLILAACSIAAPCALADTVYLKRGGTLDGEVVEGDRTIEVKLDGGSTTFNREDIERIEKTDAAHSDGSMRKAASGAIKSASAWTNQARLKAARLWKDLSKKTAGLMKPIERSAATKAKEKKLNDSLMEMQGSIKDLHKREKAISDQKRQLKKEGFHIS